MDSPEKETKEEKNESESEEEEIMIGLIDGSVHLNG